MERDKLTAETEELAEKIKNFLEILGSQPRRMEVRKDGDATTAALGWTFAATACPAAWMVAPV